MSTLHRASRCLALTLLTLALLATVLPSISAFEVKKTTKSNDAATPTNTASAPASHIVNTVKSGSSYTSKITETKSASPVAVDTPTIEPLDTAHPFAIEVSLDGLSWIPRGNIDVVFASSANHRASVKFSQERFELSQSALAPLRGIVEANGLYRVRVKSLDDSSDWVVGSTRACLLLSSAFHDHLTLHFDIHGALLAVTVVTPTTHCAESDLKAFPSQASLVSKGGLSLGRSGVRPQNVRVRLQAGESSAAAASDAKKEEEQSFFSKYWMYIVPFGAFMLVKAFLAPGEKQGAAGGAARPAS